MEEIKKSNFDNLKHKGELDIYGNVIDWDTEGTTDVNLREEDKKEVVVPEDQRIIVNTDVN